MNYLEIVTTAAKKLNLLNSHGQLGVVDSLGIIDIINELEGATQLQVPTSALTVEAFVSLESIASLLQATHSSASSAGQ